MIPSWVIFDTIILTIVITAMLYLNKIINSVFVHNSLYSIMNSNFYRRVSCNFVQCLNYTRLYNLNLIKYLCGLICLTIIWRLFNYSLIPYTISFLWKSIFRFSTSYTDPISTWGHVPHKIVTKWILFRVRTDLVLSFLTLWKFFCLV